MFIILFLYFLTVLSSSFSMFLPTSRLLNSSFAPCARFLETVQDSHLKKKRATICYNNFDMSHYIRDSLLKPDQLVSAVVAMQQEAVGYPAKRVVCDDRYHYMSDLFVRAREVKSVNKDVLYLYKLELDQLYVDGVIKAIKKILPDDTPDSLSEDIDRYHNGLDILKKALKQQYFPEQARASLYNTESIFMYIFENVLRRAGYVDAHIERRFLHAKEIIHSAQKKENNKE